jgi:hypothetical protein
MRLQTPQDLLLFEQDLCGLLQCERPDPLLLRSRPFVDFRSAALAHMASPGSTPLEAGQRIHFWLVGLAIRVEAVHPDGCLDACIDPLEVAVDI